MLGLTERQQQCLEGFLARKTAKEIGRELGISHHAVEQHLKASRKKLGAPDSAAAARIYAEATTTIEPYYDLPELPQAADCVQSPPHPERLIASFRVAAHEERGRAYALRPSQVCGAVGLSSVALTVILALLVAIAQGVQQLTS